MKNLLYILFIIHLLTRIIFILSIGFLNNYDLQPDSIWLVDFGLNSANINFNYELDRFVVSPLFPFLVGLLKIIFGDNWNIMLISIQLIISALSGVYIYKIGTILFNKKTGLLASLLFSLFPMTLWFTNTFSQECLFQALFIFSIYFLVKSIKETRVKYVIISSIFFSLTYLTKSHILLFSVFIPIIFFHFFNFKKETFTYSIIFATISLLFSVPYGINTYIHHNQYIISSNGAGYQFYLGNTEAGYKSIVDVPKKDTKEYLKIKNINLTAGYINCSHSHYDSIIKLPQKEKQSAFYNEAINWIINNPGKFIELKMYNAFFFIIPGVSWRHYSFNNWVFSFIISFPIYLFAYVSIFIMLRKNNKNGLFILYIFVSMFLFSIIWYVQNRFRTITIEPFYIVYSANIFMNFIEKKYPIVNKHLTSIVDKA